MSQELRIKYVDALAALGELESTTGELRAAYEAYTKERTRLMVLTKMLRDELASAKMADDAAVEALDDPPMFEPIKRPAGLSDKLAALDRK